MKVSFLRTAAFLALVLISTTICGCSKERVVTDDPEEIEKARKAHVEMTKRELQER